MLEKKVIVRKHKGIKSRAASSLVKKAIGYKSKINITYGNRTANIKSLISVMALKIPEGATLTVTVSGDDEVLAMDEIVRWLSYL